MFPFCQPGGRGTQLRGLLQGERVRTPGPGFLTRVTHGLDPGREQPSDSGTEVFTLALARDQDSCNHRQLEKYSSY